MISSIQTLLFAGATMLLTCPLQARPLDAQSCARLKVQRDSLEASGVRSLMTGQPPTRPQRTLDDNAQRIVALILLDGQLRFRCNMEMPIASLKPELLVEVPDTIDGEPAKVAPLKRPAAKVSPKPRPKPKPKSEDAFRAPAGKTDVPQE